MIELQNKQSQLKVGAFIAIIICLVNQKYNNDIIIELIDIIVFKFQVRNLFEIQNSIDISNCRMIVLVLLLILAISIRARSFSNQRKLNHVIQSFWFIELHQKLQLSNQLYVVGYITDNIIIYFDQVQLTLYYLLQLNQQYKYLQIWQFINDKKRSEVESTLIQCQIPKMMQLSQQLRKEQ
ncbi:Hypothetical_protein [Hexamita inflata]|uniref:Hypothetical_protein n=1 Tax=Hexamita inflata TaxID=28002 RepID=A0ABP1KJF7_9EUKA